MKKLSILLALILLFAPALTACESSGSGGGGSASSFNVTMTDFKFNPATLNVSAGQKVTINLKNSGTVQHTFTVMKTPVSGSFNSSDQSNVLFDSGPVDPGGSKTVTFTTPSTAGDYQYICTVQGHLEAGMQGHLIVK